MSFNIGLTGLNSSSSDLSVVGNNIANSGTSGFKKSRAEFANLFVQSYGSISKTSVGSGAKLAATPQQFTQGSLDYTENVMDMGISGQGFFIMKEGDNNDSISYTRAGAFQVDKDGYVVNSQGQKLQTYAVKENNNYSTDQSLFIPVKSGEEFNVGDLRPLQLPLANQEPTTTGKTIVSVNLRSDAEPIKAIDGTVIEFNQNDPDTYNYSTSVTVYDSLGLPRNLTYYFRKVETDPPVPTWDVYADLDNKIDNTTALSPLVGSPLTFDANGKLTSPTALIEMPFPDLALYNPKNGAEIGTAATDGVISVDFSSMTQFGTQYTVNELSQNGNAVGRLSGLEVDVNGIVFSRYTNGQSKALGQVALANFNNPQGLQVMGNNSWIETAESGAHTYDAPGNGELGSIQSGALEASNVDVAAELVNLITAQRNYQANAKTISTADQMVQTILNLQ
ncbi:flagellar hook protein FlgE [Chromatium okenii]|jgi:flagellar hook protein FlgE|uniref:Flagellar hook protein FlgE n=1 Tax=Chromatium okenii TaxID=61644 RepID=A0A2S7XNH5_9GAMM|nr:flagellar hook protein FlgE [Chromatium okenii]MBV5309728.1 flagellar hook protein FlgE [Chromatium okenii]PQJ95275.1 flagellar hook protein FlgE [Chromatium okenii]